METATIFSIFFSCLLIGLTGYSLYTSFGNASSELRDPFEEHED
uniref:Protein PsbN n=1 Tax=Mesostigma viride TaxID=41882 RepID=PSBN_MESVI|nr:photosystem II protein N [Mesostigma viride]Q9MUV5.1 RecName: Full=Protein PsbN [Mesostigma viride]AAF43796.1 N protein of photosystem II [Mesostigma viride]WKT08285.1 N protein of photosystem II [Mesostigma viride]